MSVGAIASKAATNAEIAALGSVLLGGASLAVGAAAGGAVRYDAALRGRSRDSFGTVSGETAGHALLAGGIIGSAVTVITPLLSGGGGDRLLPGRGLLANLGASAALGGVVALGVTGLALGYSFTGP